MRVSRSVTVPGVAAGSAGRPLLRPLLDQRADLGRPVSWPTGAAPARHILMPLYRAGLCEAVNIAPGRSSAPLA